MRVLVFPEGRRKVYFYWYLISSYGYTDKYRFWPPVNVLWVSKKEHAGIYYVVDSYKKQYEELLENFLRDKKVIQDLIDYAEKKEKELLSIKISNLKNTSNKELHVLYEKFYQAYRDLVRPISIIRRLDRIGTEELKKILKNKKVDDIDNAMLILSTTEKESCVAKEEKELLRIAVKAKKKYNTDPNKTKNSEFVKKKIHSLWKRYCWISLGWYDEPVRKESYYMDELLKLIVNEPEKNLKNIENKQRSTIKKRDELIKKLKFTEKEKLLVKILQECVFLKDYVKGSFSKCTLLSDKMFDEVSRRTNLEKSEVMAVTLDEMKDILVKNKKPLMKTIRKRLDYCIVLAKPGKGLKIYYNNEAKIIEKKYLKVSGEGANEFRGRSVSKGYGKGKARIIIKLDDLKNFKEGEILIANNTTPDFVPAMKKAAAIVTEEGGLTCHAAIVSRELDVPCVLGIENAVEIFNNCEILEVDADKGTVKRIKGKK